MKTMRAMLRVTLLPALAAAAMLAAAAPASAASFTATNLVSDDASAHPAPVVDPALVNPWGISASATSPFWISDNATGVITVYSVDPVTHATSKLGLSVAIPGNGSVTGQVFSTTAGSGSFNSDEFLFVSEDGTVSGWRGALGSTAETLAVASPENVYKGAAFGTTGGHSYLYAADFHSATIDTFKGDSGAPDLVGAFQDPVLPSGYAPFNVQNLNGVLFVTYAQQDVFGNEVSGAGLGIVDRFDLQGNFLGRVGSGGTLNAPWGLAIAPSSFGPLAGKLLVGNFGDGSISVFDPAGTFLGQVLDSLNAPLKIDGLWALSAGNGGSAGSSDLVYFTAGPNGETHGVFGVLTPVPEPRAWALSIAAFGVLVARVRRLRA
jgi:uncharacterized protein (TIGR03118 family)